MEDIIALIIVGALAGTAAASLLGLRQKGKPDCQWIRDTVIGIVGAIVGGFLFDLLNIDLPDALDASIELAAIVVAFVGAIVVILVVGFIQRR